MPSEYQSGTESLLIHDPAFKLLAGQPRPEFMLVGAAKCGTTSFSSYLPRHPQVRECIPKEPNYWSWGLCKRDSYQRLFVNSSPLDHPGASQQIGGEYSTSYLLHPLAPRRIKARLPQVKIIALLRNPIDRAYSHYIMARREERAPGLSFEEIIELEFEEVPQLLRAHQRGFLDPDFRSGSHRQHLDGSPIAVATHSKDRYLLDSEQALLRYYVTSLLFRSIYHDQLWRWLQLFPRAQIRIIDSARLLSNRASVMADITEFLGLQAYQYSFEELDHTWGGGSNIHNTPGSYPPMKPQTRKRLQQFFHPYNDRLFQLLGAEFQWD